MDAVAAVLLMLDVAIYSVKVISQPVIWPITVSRRTYELTRYYGPFVALVLNVFVRDMWCIQAEILRSKDESLSMTFKEEHQSECNMIGLTGAIIASIAITALQLEQLPSVNWTARAFFVNSLVLSLTSVYSATQQHKTIGRLLWADQVKNFIRVKKDIVCGVLDDYMYAFDVFMDLNSTSPRASSTGDNYQDLCDNYQDPCNYIYLPSPASCLLLSGPRLLLTASVVSFGVGLALYLGFVMSKELAAYPALDDDRNIFIFFVVMALLSYLLFAPSALLLSARAAGQTDSGDKLIADINSKRRAILKPLGNPTAFKYKRRRDQAQRRQGGREQRAEQSHDAERASDHRLVRINNMTGVRDTEERPEDNARPSETIKDSNDAGHVSDRDSTTADYSTPTNVMMLADASGPAEIPNPVDIGHVQKLPHNHLVRPTEGGTPNNGQTVSGTQEIISMAPVVADMLREATTLAEAQARLLAKLATAYQSMDETTGLKGGVNASSASGTDS